MRWFILFLIFWSGVKAESISSYDISIVVHSDGSLAVTEQIDYDFEGLRRHGIYRDIPILVSSDRGTWDIGITDVNVSMDGGYVPFVTERISSDVGPMMRMRIGSPFSKVNGDRRYTIGYKVGRAVLGMKDGRDAIRWNAIGTGWSLDIKAAKVTMILPPELHQISVDAATFSGADGSTTTQGSITQVATGKYEAAIRWLKAYEGFTVELAYPAGVLPSNVNTQTQWSRPPAIMWPWLLIILFYAVIIGVWWRYGKDQFKGSITPQYELPKDMSALRVGVLIDQKADMKDFPAAIVELAVLGYVTIDKDHTVIRTGKDSKGLAHDLREIMDKALFVTSNRFSFEALNADIIARFKALKSISNQDQMNERLEQFDTLNTVRKIEKAFKAINQYLYNRMLQQGYLRGDPQKSRRWFLWGGTFAALLCIVLGIYETLLLLPPIQIVLMGSFIVVPLILGYKMVYRERKWLVRIGTMLFTLLWVGAVAFMWEVTSLPWSWWLLMYPFPAVLLTLIPVWVLAPYMGRFTEKGVQMQRQLLGYKEFLKRVKSDEVKQYLKEDSFFLERALPYAMVFGLTKHWLEMYPLTETALPLWYKSYDRNAFDSLESFADTFSTVMTPASNSSGSSGSFSGGGSSSGGGGGGGGGGSW